MTRSEAIDLAVRRWMRIGSPADIVTQGMTNALILMSGVMTDQMQRAVRAHFRAVCRAYEVRSDARPVSRGPSFSIAPGEQVLMPPHYDGHSLRI